MKETNPKDYNKYDNQILDIDEVQGTDVKINPDYYIHNAILKAQTALADDNVKEGFTRYYIFIEHIEVLCKAANMLSDEYTSKLTEYKATKEYKDIKEPLIKNVKLANKKLELLMKEVFSKKVSTDPLKA